MVISDARADWYDAAFLHHSELNGIGGRELAFATIRSSETRRKISQKWMVQVLAMMSARIGTC